MKRAILGLLVRSDERATCQQETERKSFTNMETENIALDGMLKVRAELDQGIAYYREKLAILQKKREAVNVALDVVRSTDAELRSIALDLASEVTFHTPIAIESNRAKRITFFPL